MRIAMVSPYSWSYPGGVTRHVQGLAEQFIAQGHDVEVLAPYDPPGRLASVMHRGARPEKVVLPGYVVPLGRTVGLPLNGAVSNLMLNPFRALGLHRKLQRGDYDVVHVHEPDAPAVGWMATDWTSAPLVGTFHTYNEHRLSHAVATAVGVRRMLNRLHVRIAVSPPAAWTAERFFGGHYRVVPNGVDIGRAGSGATADEGRPPAERPLRVVFVGQAVERKGLPLLLHAFEGLRDHVPAELVLIGPSPEEVSSLMTGTDNVRVLGKVDDQVKRRELDRADVLCAPSLGGESFGMVITEAFAAGVPVVASDIAGYRDIVTDGVNGLLVPPDAQTIADALFQLWQNPERRAEMGRAALQSAEQYAWPKVADQVMAIYQVAIATPVPAGLVQRVAVRAGLRPADLEPRAKARRLPSLQPQPPASTDRRRPALRRALSLGLPLVVAALAAVAVDKMGLHSVADALARTNPGFVALGVFLMCTSMVARAVSWHASLRAGLPRAGVRLSHAMQGLFIGVLVSSTLPANLGEPSRALVVARRTSRPWETLPIVAGTMVSQALLNVAAIIGLGAVTFASVDAFSGYRTGLLAGGAIAVALFALVLLAPRALSAVGKRTGGAKLAWAHRWATRLRSGLVVFRKPRLAAVAISAQVCAWALQWLAVYVLLAALHLASSTGLLGAAAVLFAINVTMLLPVTPGDVGVFQAAAAAVLNAGWSVAFSRGVAFGVVLQASELLTALLMGVPALLKEGLSWRQVTNRLRLPPKIVLPNVASPRGPGTVHTARKQPVADA